MVVEKTTRFLSQRFNIIFNNCICRSIKSLVVLPKTTMMKSLLILFAIISLCKTQRYMFPMYNMYKPGVCPEARGPCRVFCMQDGECPGNSKCCRTSCGGRLCLPPTTNEDSYGGESPFF